MSKNSGQLHEGHRQRLKQRFLRGGIASMSEHEVLELVLTYAIPRMNVNPLAHRLINKYGSLRAVLNAEYSSLIENDGVSRHTAVLLCLFGKAAAGQIYASPSKQTQLTNVGQAAAFCRSMLGAEEAETSLVVMLDCKSRVVDYYTEFGSLDHVSINSRELARRALNSNASSVILAHIHPSGLAELSDADKVVFNKISYFFNDLNLRLSEVFIITDSCCFAALHNVRLEGREPDQAENNAAELPISFCVCRSRRKSKSVPGADRAV